jgi:cytochrome c biogenesis protein CcmG, thiol:disulfide interchange protein DsbE
MNRKIRFSLVAAFLALSLVFAGCSGDATPSATPSGQPPTGLAVGELAPDFRLNNLEGEPVLLSELRGKIVLLNFWASWCGPCRAEMPSLQQVSTEWQDKGLLIVGINIGENADTVEGFLKNNGLTFSVLLDSASSVADTYAVRYIPTTFILDKSGVIQMFKVGPFLDKAEIEDFLNRITSG